MKKIVSFFFCLILIAALALPCTAASVRTDDTLTAQQAARLQTLFDAIRDKYGIEAFFVVNYDYEGGDAFKEYARAYLDENKSGVDAMVFAVSSTTYYMNARGKAGELIRNDDLDDLYDAFSASDKKGKNYDAAVQFYAALERLLAERAGVSVNAPEPATETAADGAQITCVRTDNALTEKQASHLQTLYQAIRDAYGIEALFVINYDYTGGDAFSEYVTGYLDDNRQTDDAVIFAVSSDSFRLNTRGKAGEWIENEDLNTLYDAISEADENGEQYSAAVSFYDALNTLLAERSGLPAADADFTEVREILPGSVPIPDEISPVRGDRLVDQADLLSPEDEAALQEKLDRISEEMQFDVVIVTCEHIGNRTPMEFADDYFDYNGFGYGENYDGVALLISMAERDWWISTCGYGETALSDDYFLNRIDPSDFTYNLKNGNYAKSFNFFADIVQAFVTEAKTNEPYSEHHRYHLASSMRTGLIWSAIIGLVVAAFTTYYQYNNYTGSVHTRGEANEYMVDGVHLSEQDDRFLYSKVYREKRPEPTSSSSSSGSSHHSSGSHTSSSGRSHGGGGGKF